MRKSSNPTSTGSSSWHRSIMMEMAVSCTLIFPPNLTYTTQVRILHGPSRGHDRGCNGPALLTIEFPLHETASVTTKTVTLMSNGISNTEKSAGMVLKQRRSSSGSSLIQGGWQGKSDQLRLSSTSVSPRALSLGFAGMMGSMFADESLRREASGDTSGQVERSSTAAHLGDKLYTVTQ